MLGRAVPLCVLCLELGVPFWPLSPTSGQRITALLRREWVTILTHYPSHHYSYLMLGGTLVRLQWALRCTVTVNILASKVSEIVLIIVLFIRYLYRLIS